MQKEERKTEFWKQVTDKIDEVVAPGTYDLPSLKYQDSHNHG
jgi:hypothetical protein